MWLVAVTTFLKRTRRCEWEWGWEKGKELCQCHLIVEAETQPQMTAWNLPSDDLIKVFYLLVLCVCCFCLFCFVCFFFCFCVFVVFLVFVDSFCFFFWQLGRKANCFSFTMFVTPLVMFYPGSLDELLVQVGFSIASAFCLVFSSESNDWMPSDLHVFQVSLNLVIICFGISTSLLEFVWKSMNSEVIRQKKGKKLF